jgi:hypothetical protein
MCTVSVLRLPRGVLRVACNRDEQVTRAAALPPVVRRFGERRAVMPIDPVSDGTWVAVNDAGVVMALLNSNPTMRRSAVAPRSRGVIIPMLLGCGAARAAAAVAMTLSPRRFGPFRLVVLDCETSVEVMSDGTALRHRSVGDRGAALVFTSSGLGDHVVERPRTVLFRRMLGGGVPSAEAQDAFHRHGWVERPHVSVRMRRADARTVSTTVVEVSPAGIRMSYRAEEDGAAAADAVEHVVSLSPGAVPCGSHR